jgi:hypothetical protein
MIGPPLNFHRQGLQIIPQTGRQPVGSSVSVFGGHLVYRILNEYLGQLIVTSWNLNRFTWLDHLWIPTVKDYKLYFGPVDHWLVHQSVHLVNTKLVYRLLNEYLWRLITSLSLNKFTWFNHHWISTVEDYKSCLGLADDWSFPWSVHLVDTWSTSCWMNISVGSYLP